MFSEIMRLFTACDNDWNCDYSVVSENQRLSTRGIINLLWMSLIKLLLTPVGAESGLQSAGLVHL